MSGNAGRYESSGDVRRFRITHPFHPLRGHELEIHNLVTVGGVPLVCYITDAAMLVSIPVSWTSLRSVDDLERVSGGRSLWRIDDLVGLRGIIDAHLESSATHDQE